MSTDNRICPCALVSLRSHVGFCLTIPTEEALGSGLLQAALLYI